MDVREKITLSVTETAALLGVSRPLVYQLIHRRDFPSFKIGGRTVISRKALEEWVASQVNQNLYNDKQEEKNRGL